MGNEPVIVGVDGSEESLLAVEAAATDEGPPAERQTALAGRPASATGWSWKLKDTRFGLVHQGFGDAR